MKNERIATIISEILQYFAISNTQRKQVTCTRYHSYDTLEIALKILLVKGITSKTRRARNRYPLAIKQSLKALYMPPLYPRNPPSNSPTRIMKSILEYFTTILPPCSKYSAMHIPIANSHRYCKKKLPQIRSVAIPVRAVNIHHITLQLQQRMRNGLFPTFLFKPHSGINKK